MHRTSIIRRGVLCYRPGSGVLQVFVFVGGGHDDDRLDRDHLTGVDLGLSPARLLDL